MMILYVLLAVVGIAICFRGVYLAKACNALFGAIQGLIWAVVLQLVLTLFGLLSGIANIWYIVMAVIALITGYLAAFKQKIYQTIQGIFSGLITGSVIAVIIYLAMSMRSFTSGSTSSLAPIIALCVIVGFVALGAYKSAFFRRIGSLLIAFLLLTAIIVCYLSIGYAALIAIVISVLGAIALQKAEEYLPVVKIALFGAVVTVVAAWAFMYDEFILSFIGDNISSLLSFRSGYGMSGDELTLPFSITIILTILGAASQISFLKTHEYSELSLASDAREWLLTRVGNVSYFVTTHKKAIIKAVLSVVGVFMLIVAMIYGPQLIASTKQKVLEHQETTAVNSSGNSIIDTANQLCGIDYLVLDEAYLAEQSGDETTSGFEATVTNGLYGKLYVTGWFDENRNQWECNYMRIETQAMIGQNEHEVARLYAAVLKAIYGYDSNQSLAIIEEIMLTTDFSPKGPYKLDTYVEVPVGNTDEVVIDISLTDSGTVWTMSSGTVYEEFDEFDY